MVKLGAAMKANGALPFMNFNRLHVVPPCTVSEGEAKEGLEILDTAFAAIASYYTG
jgi:taurine--2-oxoglutarate transaminase